MTSFRRKCWGTESISIEAFMWKFCLKEEKTPRDLFNCSFVKSEVCLTAVAFIVSRNEQLWNYPLTYELQLSSMKKNNY